ncbi:MAG: S-layer homology domain-containing protein [Eubacteriales bacterium]
MKHLKLFKKILAHTLSLALTLACFMPAVNAAEVTAGNQPSDYFLAAEDLSSKVSTGYEDSIFEPDQPVTREEAAKTISQALGLNTANVKNPGFNDVKESDYFYAYIAALSNEGILEGHDDGSFKPKDTLTRAQIAKLLSKGFKLGEEKLADNPFNDVKESDWFSIYLPALITNEIILGKTADTYDPNGVVTRAQMAEFMQKCRSIGRPLNGFVYAGAPVSDAVLSVYDTQGNQILNADDLATDVQGSIFRVVLNDQPSNFRIVAEGGTLNGQEFAAKLSSDIRGFNSYSDTIYINPATTIVSAYLDKHPRANLSEAELEVKKFLEIPQWIDLASGTQLSNNYFSNDQFLKEAGENGGINSFIEKLLTEIDAQKTHHFQTPSLLQGGAGAFIAKTLAEGALTYVGGELMGWGLAEAGISFGEEDHTAEELANIEAGIADMKSQMTEMSIQLDAISNKLDSIVNQLKDMLKQLSHKMALDEYGTRVGQLNSLISSVDSIQRDLNYFVNNTPSNPEQQRQNLINRIEHNIIDQSDVIHNQLVGIGGQKPLLTLWREIVYENRYLDSEDYDKVKAQYDYFRQYQDSILLLQVEYYHAIEGTTGENAAVIMNCIARYEEHLEQQEVLLALPIEKYTVVDTKWDGMYYSENIELGKFDSAFILSGKTKSQVSTYLSDFAHSNYAGLDWEILNYDSIGALIENHIFNRTPWLWSEFLFDQGWPGVNIEYGTAVPFFDQKTLVYLLTDGSHFQSIFDYPEAGLKYVEFYMIMAYRQVTAHDYGYSHLKN